MPVCVICQADGVVCINDEWYCQEHIDEAFLYVASLVASYHGWDQGETEQELTEWLTAEPPEPTNQGEQA